MSQEYKKASSMGWIGSTFQLTEQNMLTECITETESNITFLLERKSIIFVSPNTENIKSPTKESPSIILPLQCQTLKESIEVEVEAFINHRTACEQRMHQVY